MDWLDWLLLVARVVVVFFALLILVMLLIWMERKVIADMQTRVGPTRAGPRGVLITLADGIKLFFKEGITPALAGCCSGARCRSRSRTCRSASCGSSR